MLNKLLAPFERLTGFFIGLVSGLVFLVGAIMAIPDYIRILRLKSM
jgi:hypothetical protein